MSELGRRGENENTQTSKRENREDSNSAFADCESGILPLNYRDPIERDIYGKCVEEEEDVIDRNKWKN